MDNFDLRKYLAEGRLLKEQLMPKRISDKPFTIVYQVDDMTDYEAYDELLSDREQDLILNNADVFIFDSNTPADEIEDYILPDDAESGNDKLERYGLSKYWRYDGGRLNENQDDSYYIDEIKRDLEELDDKEANEYLEELAKSILKLKR
tara:strand:+ start:5 stop:451 length:447 start_codon:yes stop_codon:yes gene_type:complete